MPPELKIDARAVGALILVGDYPGGAFVGVRHTSPKEISEKLSDQISFFTETKKPGEDDGRALDRLFRVEEAFINGVSDKECLEGIKLSDSTLATRIGIASLATYLFVVNGELRAEILDGEIAEIGLVLFETVLKAPKGSWWVRWNVYEAVSDVMGWLNNPNAYVPRKHIQFRDRVPPEIFELINQGISEREALCRTGLHLPNEPLPWSFARSISTQVYV